MLGKRQPFPPTDNPWKYAPMPSSTSTTNTNYEDNLQFNMMTSVLAMILSGAIVGWLITSYIPLLPNWIGTLCGSITIGYSTTLLNSRGDMLRLSLIHI